MEFEKAYSNNIYREMIIEDLKREFDKTEQELNDYKSFLETGQIKREVKPVEYMIGKLTKKQLGIKEMLNRFLKQAYIMEV